MDVTEKMEAVKKSPSRTLPSISAKDMAKDVEAKKNKLAQVQQSIGEKKKGLARATATDCSWVVTEEAGATSIPPVAKSSRMEDLMAKSMEGLDGKKSDLVIGNAKSIPAAHVGSVRDSSSSSMAGLLKAVEFDQVLNGMTSVCQPSESDSSVNFFSTPARSSVSPVSEPATQPVLDVHAKEAILQQFEEQLRGLTNKHFTAVEALSSGIRLALAEGGVFLDDSTKMKVVEVALSQSAKVVTLLKVLQGNSTGALAPSPVPRMAADGDVAIFVGDIPKDVDVEAFRALFPPGTQIENCYGRGM